MTGLLVSVRSAAEAAEALDGGADLLDIKEPRRGALGPAPIAVWDEVRRTAAGRAPLSAALGELLNDPVEATAPYTAGFRFAKIGLAGCAPAADWPDRWERACRGLAASVAPVAVVYADWRAARAPTPDETLAHAARLGCAALLVDTWSKQRGDLFAHLDHTRLAEWCAQARAAGMQCVLGGSLTLESVDQALALEPDFIAVRGAACGGNRAASIARRCVSELAARIAKARRAAT